MRNVEPIRWTDEGVVMLDQRRLPVEVVYLTYTDYREVAAAIKDMVIRGAPAIGVAAAMGVALGVCIRAQKHLPNFAPNFRKFATLSRARVPPPSICSGPSTDEAQSSTNCRNPRHGCESRAIKSALVAEAQQFIEKLAQGRSHGPLRRGIHAAQAGIVMTQCNAGALATAGIGTALGVIRTAVENGHKLDVLVPETRPYLQGARLTAWELQQDGIPLTLITDNMVGHFMKTGRRGRDCRRRGPHRREWRHGK